MQKEEFADLVDLIADSSIDTDASSQATTLDALGARFVEIKEELVATGASGEQVEAFAEGIIAAAVRYYGTHAALQALLLAIGEGLGVRIRWDDDAQRWVAATSGGH